MKPAGLAEKYYDGGLRECGSKGCLFYGAELMYHSVKRQFARKKRKLNLRSSFAFFEFQIFPEIVSSIGLVFGQLAFCSRIQPAWNSIPANSYLQGGREALQATKNLAVSLTRVLARASLSKVAVENSTL